MQELNCRAILFDLDGVLVDSTRSVDRFWRWWAAENELDPETAVNVAHGRRTVETVRILKPELNAEVEAIKLERMEADRTADVTVMPGAAELLANIPRDRWCVVTSGTKYLATSRIAAGRLPLPEILITADDVKNGKPHPEPYLQGARLLGIEPREGLVVEDAPAGIRAARAAGMTVIGLASTYGAEELSEADAVIATLADLEVRSHGSTIRIKVARNASP